MRLRDVALIAGRIQDELPDGLPVVSSEISVQAAAQVLGKSEATGLIIQMPDSTTLYVSASKLLLELALDRDTLTGLPRSGAARDWMLARLEEKLEISVLFIDMDGFREVNRSQGHAEGDALLASVGRLIDGCCDLRIDFPARFGGDEFIVASLRHRSEAESLAFALTQCFAENDIEATVGVSGGRRSAKRADDHNAALVEDLISFASRECLAIKRSKS